MKAMLALMVGTGLASVVGAAAAQQAVSPDTPVGMQFIISIGLLVAAAVIVFRAGAAFAEAMRAVRAAAAFGATVQNLVTTVDALADRVAELEARSRAER